ncbi:MAG: SDR family NAD(P)-dependent oxidoreductase [Candidatus Zambryskibacteria bacterium]
MFKNKTAVVTGAAKGIGYGIALAFAKEGANVVMADLDKTANENSAREIEELTKSKCVGVECDVSKKEDVDALIKTATEKFGALDILVNNAGIFPFKPFLELTESDWDKVLDINLKSVFFCSQAAAKIMKEGSKIVTISSIASLIGFENLTHYCASKGGINGLTRALALELAPKKINVNAIAPGLINTPGVSAGMNDEAIKQMTTIIPWGRAGLPEDIASAVVFLASSQSDYITGQVIVVDGGWTLK